MAEHKLQELENALKTKDIQIKSKDGKIKILEMDILNLKQGGDIIWTKICHIYRN